MNLYNHERFEHTPAQDEEEREPPELPGGGRADEVAEAGAHQGPLPEAASSDLLQPDHGAAPRADIVQGC